MTIRFQALAVFAAALFASNTFAQTSFPEAEPNSLKSEATAVTGIVAGDFITGTSTGTTATAASTLITTIDTFRVQTAAAPLGIYKHTLTLSTLGQTTALGHTGSIRGLTQATGGVIGTAEAAVQTSTAAAGTPLRANHWFGFGKQEELYYRVTGTTATTNAYTSTLSTATVIPQVIPGTFAAGSITLTTIGQTTADTEIFIYDSNLNPVVGYHNDDEGPVGPTLQSRLTRTYAAGTYFISISDNNYANNLSDANPDEDFTTSAVLDFPNVLVSSDRETGPVDYDFTIAAGGPAVPVTFVGNGEYDAAWGTFTVVGVLPPPANDNCASASVITVSASGSLSSATNDGLASCDTGGGASRDVWYSYTVPPSAVFGGTFSADTCGSATDTVLSVYSSCGGAELACNDDCGGAPCGGTSSCVSLTTLVANQNVLIRVSDKGLGGTGFNLNVSFAGNPPTNDSCATPIAIGPGSTPFDTTQATTGAEGQTEALCLNAASTAIFKDLWFLFTPTQSSTVTVTNCGLTVGSPSSDSRIAVYAGSACPTAGTAVSCNDDDALCATTTLNSTLTFSATCGTQYLIQVGAFGATGIIVGSFTVTEGAGTPCSTPAVVECTGDTAAFCPCSGSGGSGIPNPGATGSGCANSFFPAGATLSSSGNAVDNAGDTLVLTCTNMTGPGLFFQSNSTVSVINFDDGRLCAAVGILRMGVVFPTAGVASYPGGTTPFPIHIAGAPVQTGGSPTPPTKHYQVWYRDNTPGFCNTQGDNLSNGLAIVWAP